MSAGPGSLLGCGSLCRPDPPTSHFSLQGKELLAQKLPLWQQACADPNKIPDRAVQLLQQLASSNGAILPGALSASKSSLVISDPIPGAKPLPVPPELAPFVGVSARRPEGCGCGVAPPAAVSTLLRLGPHAALLGLALLQPRPCRLFPQRLSAQENAPIMNGVSGPDSEDYSPWADRKGAQPKSSSTQQPQTKMSDSYSNTLPVRKSVAPKNSYAASKGSWLPRSWGGPRLTHVCACVCRTLGPGETPP